MQYLMAFILTIILYFWLKKTATRYIWHIKKDYDAIKNECDNMAAQNSKLKRDNDELKITLEQTIALYDITKQICRNLDESKLLISFEQEFPKYLRVQDFKFIKGEADLSLYGDYTVLPLKIEKQNLGYLVAKGVNEYEKDKFYILANQFLLGVRRSLLYQKVQELAIMDGLTGVLSRRYFLERFNEELVRSKKFKYSFSFLMVDIDHFKECNDKYGHLVGDVLLKEISKIIKENLRQIDLVGRYGGEEFSIVLTETDRQGSVFAAERIRQSVEARHIRAYDEDLKVAISIGISVFPGHGQSAASLIEKADQALYRAKEAGRNKICVYESKNK